MVVDSLVLVCCTETSAPTHTRALLQHLPPPPPYCLLPCLQEGLESGDFQAYPRPKSYAMYGQVMDSKAPGYFPLHIL